MGQPVDANGRSILHKGHGMTHTCAVPDVCKTPTPAGPVPIPYINIAMDSDLDGTKTVKIEGNPVANISKKIITSTGDEPGTVGGIISSRVKGTMNWKMGSLDVKAEGKQVVRFLDTAFHNGNTFNTTFVDQGMTGWAYGDDEPCKKCNEPFEKHRIHATEEARTKADQLFQHLNAIYAGQEAAIRASLRLRGLAAAIQQEINRLSEERAPLAVGMNTKAKSALPLSKAIAHLTALQLEKLSEAKAISATLDGTHLFRKHKDTLDVYIHPYMVGVCACKCGDHKVGACSAQATPGFKKAVSECGLTLVETPPAMSAGQKDALQADGKKNWDCAAPKLIEAIKGHKPRFMLEFWYQKTETVDYPEVLYEVGEEKRRIAPGSITRPTSDSAEVKRVKKFHGPTKVSEKTEHFKSGETTPSCTTCQLNLPEMLCNADDECKA